MNVGESPGAVRSDPVLALERSDSRSEESANAAPSLACMLRAIAGGMADRERAPD